MKIKVCGMRDNIAEVAALAPDMMGFIFWEPSSRFLGDQSTQMSENIKKVGVFVDEPLKRILREQQLHRLDLIQLHGSETPEFCSNLRNELDGVQVIKAFAVDEQFDFSTLEAYEATCDYFLFDTKGKLPGGNSRRFNWNLLAANPSSKPFFISGGIGPDDLDDLQAFLRGPLGAQCIAVDVNSRFETVPGHKDIARLSAFINSFKLLDTKNDL